MEHHLRKLDPMNTWITDKIQDNIWLITLTVSAAYAAFIYFKIDWILGVNN